MVLFPKSLPPLRSITNLFRYLQPLQPTPESPLHLLKGFMHDAQDGSDKKYLIVESQCPDDWD